MRKIILLSIFMALSGCYPIAGKDGLIHNRQNNYLEAQSVPDLKVPPSLSYKEINNEYAIPGESNTPALTEPVSIDPPGSVLNPIK